MPKLRRALANRLQQVQQAWHRAADQRSVRAVTDGLLVDKALPAPRVVARALATDPTLLDSITMLVPRAATGVWDTLLATPQPLMQRLVLLKLAVRDRVPKALQDDPRLRAVLTAALRDPDLRPHARALSIGSYLARAETPDLQALAQFLELLVERPASWDRVPPDRDFRLIDLVVWAKDLAAREAAGGPPLRQQLATRPGVAETVMTHLATHPHWYHLQEELRGAWPELVCTPAWWHWALDQLHPPSGAHCATALQQAPLPWLPIIWGIWAARAWPEALVGLQALSPDRVAAIGLTREDWRAGLQYPDRDVRLAVLRVLPSLQPPSASLAAPEGEIHGVACAPSIPALGRQIWTDAMRAQQQGERSQAMDRWRELRAHLRASPSAPPGLAPAA